MEIKKTFNLTKAAVVSAALLPLAFMAPAFAVADAAVLTAGDNLKALESSLTISAPLLIVAFGVVAGSVLAVKFISPITKMWHRFTNAG